ncbi:threonine/serine ThrE exporter family protein [Luteimonas sp. e5]
MTPATPSIADYRQRVAFITELAEGLHAGGATAQRLEGALLGVAERLGVECEPWATPTGMILSFRDPADAEANELTRVVRRPPGDTDLSLLVDVDRIAEDVVAGRCGVAEGHAALKRRTRQPTARWRLVQVLGFAMVAGGIGALLRLPWLDIATAAGSGLLIGLLDQFSRRHAHLREAMEAVAALLAGIIAVTVAHFVGPLNLNTVIIASVIVFLPGLALTNAISELTGQHLGAGSARMAGAITAILKLTIGVMLALAIARVLGLEPRVAYSRPQGPWVEAAGLLVACIAFAISFRARLGDYWLVMLAAAAGYAVSRGIGMHFGHIAGVFIGALTLTTAGNLYARLRNRPGAIIRVPGIILLVPGSVSFRGMMNLMQQQDVGAGEAALMLVLNILMALAAGIMFGNLIVAPRRHL